MHRTYLSILLTHITLVLLCLGSSLPCSAQALPRQISRETISVENPANSSSALDYPKLKGSSFDSGIQLGIQSIESNLLTSPGRISFPLDETCADSRYGGAAQYLDTLTDGVFQYFDNSNDLSFPFTPDQLNIGLYYLNEGTTADSLRLVIGLNCRNFGEVCCTPKLQECYGSVTVARGSPFPSLLNLTIDLSLLDCCYEEGFWVGVLIDTVYSGEQPSFLFTSRASDPHPIPTCEQWLMTAGEITHEAIEDLGWVMLSISGECGSCGESTLINCETSNPGPDLNCSQYLLITCDAEPYTLSNQSNSGSNSDVSSYCCSSWDESGPERLYAVDVTANSSLTVELLEVVGGDVDLFVLDSCSAGNCLAAGDSAVQLFGLAAGIYFIVVDGYEGDEATYDLRFTCRADCPAAECAGEVRYGSPSGNLYLDGEWDRSLDAMYYSYYAGSGSIQEILSGDPEVCELSPSIIWTSIDQRANRLLAADPRNGGQFWCGTITDYELGSGHLYLINMSGAVVHSWSAVTNLPCMRWSGGAFDPDHNHLWVFIRDSIDAGGSRVYELDVSNASSPMVIQGPHLVPQSSPHFSLSTGGADYCDETDILLLAHQGYPVDFVEFLIDVEPDYAGPPPGPGLLPDFWCSPDSNAIQGYGVAAYDEGGDAGEFLMLNFTDEDFYHPINKYPSPTRLRPPDCPAVDNLIIRRSGLAINLRWQPDEMGIFKVYSSTNPHNDGDPDDGADPDFTLRTTILGSGTVSWNDNQALADYKVYVVVRICN